MQEQNACQRRARWALAAADPGRAKQLAADADKEADVAAVTGWLQSWHI
jgi:hypothetical protein